MPRTTQRPGREVRGQRSWENINRLMEPSLWYLLAALLVVAGLIGTVLPVLPGALLVFAGLFVAAWADDFAPVGKFGLTVIAFLGLLSAAADFFGTVMGAKRVGASPQALIGAT